jgi:hypothetical protein
MINRVMLLYRMIASHPSNCCRLWEIASLSM